MRDRSCSSLGMLLFAMLIASDGLVAQDWKLRFAVQKAVPIVDAETDFTNYQLGVGYVSADWLVLSPHLYITYDDYGYHHIWISTSVHEITATGIFPAVKIGPFLLIGYGYTFGKEMRFARYSQDTTLYSKGNYFHWSSFLAADFDIYVYRDIYLTLGFYVKRPINYLSVGLSVRL